MIEPLRKTVSDVLSEYAGLARFSDGRIDYSGSDSAPVVTVVVRAGDEVLLLKRSGDVATYRGLWQLVAGYIDEDVSLREKALSELAEETGISEEGVRAVRSAEQFRFIDEERGLEWLVFPVLVVLEEKEEVVLDREHTECAWVSPDGIEEYEMVPNGVESVRRALI